MLACYSFNLVTPFFDEASIFLISTVIFGGYLLFMSERIALQISVLSGLRVGGNIS